MLKVLVGVALVFLLFSKPQARKVTAELLPATVNALAPAMEEKTPKKEKILQERITGDVVNQITDKQ